MIDVVQTSAADTLPHSIAAAAATRLHAIEKSTR
jgi:hypothetical protein